MLRDERRPEGAAGVRSTIAAALGTGVFSGGKKCNHRDEAVIGSFG
jgi:hypothetical protein